MEEVPGWIVRCAEIETAVLFHQEIVSCLTLIQFCDKQMANEQFNSNSTPLPLHLQTQKACTLSQPTPPNTKKPLLYIPPNSPCSPIQQLHHLPPQPIRNPSLSRGAPTRKKSVFTQEAIFSRGVNQGNRNGRDYEISSPIVHQTMEEVRHVEVEKMLGVQVLRDAENRISFTGVELDTDGAMI